MFPAEVYREGKGSSKRGFPDIPAVDACHYVVLEVEAGGRVPGARPTRNLQNKA